MQKDIISIKICVISYTYFLFRVNNGISDWASSKKRLDWHETVDSTFLQVKENPNFIPSAKFITDSSKFGPIEITLNSPYRAGMMNVSRRRGDKIDLTMGMLIKSS